ncbi:protein DpdE [Mesorhizobium sp.]|uniref:protein DpdE n=1 Tax=Mesorhizobium sp. TaxID=1871066 RepID=UPI000FE362C5|nr:protein DpdE [Mesorhizobium sp.]RWO03017.1 MAG: hypothetical protein EOS06_02570 [Mesorhizobium sp.]
MLVTLPGRRGVGTIINARTDWCEVEAFHSIEKSDLEYYPTDTLSRALVGPETRVYVRWGENWRIGRIKDYDTATLPWIEYLVRFPNGITSDVAERDLRVRVFEPHADPAEVLARGGGETQYLHDRRWSALATSTLLRAAAEGLTGALSSKIELVPHQLAAARRVLTDPVQRFLLADEVGMGKTIEAGIIARQCLIDDPTRQVRVLAPRPLVAQWKRELFERFDLREWSSQVMISSHDDILAPSGSTDLLIVDEAHNLLNNDHSLECLIRQGHAARRLLLLSATPALGSTRDLLNLLHVLDPAAYGLDDIDKLESRLEIGRDLGRVLLSLDDDAPVFLIKRSARAIAARLPDDRTVAELAEQLESDKPAGDGLADLRQHLADTYRVHQRLIRARRREATVYFRPRGVAIGTARDHLRTEVDEDLRWPEILVSLEDWRDHIRFQIDEGAGATPALALPLIEAIDAIGVGKTPPNIAEAPASLLASLKADKGDRTKEVVAVDTIRSLLKRLEKDGQRSAKIVAFATTGKMTGSVVDALLEQGIMALQLADSDTIAEIQAVVEDFENASRPVVLLCDRSGEEGLNLNFADGIVHLDLPFSVTRMEQRIGRLDRFGRSKSLLRQRVLLPSDDALSPWAAWLDVLSQGFEIFESSTSDVQIILPALEAELACAYLERGVDGLREMIDPVRERIAAARRAADEQYALDAVALSDGAGNLAERIDDAESDEPALRTAVEAWLVSALQLRRIDQGPDQVSYAWTQETLIPKRPWEDEFGAGRDRRLTWRRNVAMRRNASILRPGAPLFDAMDRNIRWDDRGSAFATWRVDPRVAGTDIAWTGFRLCFVIEPSLEGDLGVFRSLDAHGATRRAQGFLPPWTQVIHFDLDGEAPPEAVLDVLASPYHNGVRDQGGRDINLCSRPALLASVITPTLFARRCRDARTAAEAHILSDPTFVARIEGATRAAERDGRRRARFGDREAAGGAAILDAVKSPRVRLDSMGFFILSRDPPARIS